jgi:hypothetical protein
MIETVVGDLVSNLGVTFTQLVLLMTVLGSLIFIAVELRLGLLLLFFMTGIETIVFWSYGVATTDLSMVVSVFLSSFVLMAVSLLLIKPKQGYGGII